MSSPASRMAASAESGILNRTPNGASRLSSPHTNWRNSSIIRRCVLFLLMYCCNSSGRMTKPLKSASSTTSVISSRYLSSRDGDTSPRQFSLLFKIQKYIEGSFLCDAILLSVMPSGFLKCLFRVCLKYFRKMCRQICRNAAQLCISSIHNRLLGHPAVLSSRTAVWLYTHLPQHDTTGNPSC